MGMLVVMVMLMVIVMMIRAGHWWCSRCRRRRGRGRGRRRRRLGDHHHVGAIAIVRSRCVRRITAVRMIVMMIVIVVRPARIGTIRSLGTFGPLIGGW